MEFDTGNHPVSYLAQQVVLAMPPRLLAESIIFEPTLAPELIRAMQDIPTWMAGHAKAMLVYPEAFWRYQGYSGNALQPYPGSVLAEIYDAYSKQGESAALFGFFGLPAFTRELYRDNIEALIMQQITRLFGNGSGKSASCLYSGLEFGTVYRYRTIAYRRQSIRAMDIPGCNWIIGETSFIFVELKQPRPPAAIWKARWKRATAFLLH